jgi:hypothetical protein
MLAIIGGDHFFAIMEYLLKILSIETARTSKVPWNTSTKWKLIYVKT